MLRRILDSLVRTRAPQYLLVGGLAFATEYCLFLGLFYVVTLSGSISNVVSFCTGLAVSFTLNKIWVFQGNQSKKTSSQFGLYLLVAGMNLAITTLAINYLLGLGTPAFVAKFFLIAAIAVWNFFIFQRIIFRKNN